eukprot:5075681-Amphidinium_carterae.1
MFSRQHRDVYHHGGETSGLTPSKGRTGSQRWYCYMRLFMKVPFATHIETMYTVPPKLIVPGAASPLQQLENTLNTLKSPWQQRRVIRKLLKL